MSKPWLSIGMIVKNEIRCIEKCLKALQPLRDAFPCELVIADTGSNDGTREIAEKYADILFDFEWINDFAAARNAVMDRCSGEWFLSVDADEYLVPDLSGFKKLLKADQDKVALDAAYICIKNYQTIDMDENLYNFFYALRMTKLSLGFRFKGAIHEYIDLPSDRKRKIVLLENIIFDHDGYAFQSNESKLQKGKRNLELLEQELQSDPYNMGRWMQCLESSAWIENRRPAYAIQAMKILTELKDPKDKILINAAVAARSIEIAVRADLSQAKEWIIWTWEHYSDVSIVRIDAVWYILQWCFENQNFEYVVQLADLYLDAVHKFRTEDVWKKDSASVVLKEVSEVHIQTVQILKGTALCKINRLKEAYEVAAAMDFVKLTEGTMIQWLKFLVHLTEIPQTKKIFSNIVDYFCQDVEDAKIKKKKAIFFTFAVKVFEFDEKQSDGVKDPWRIFIECKGILGQAARIMATENLQIMQEIINEVTDWEHVSSVVYLRIFSRGVHLPNTFYKQSIDIQSKIILALANKDEFFAQHLLMHPFDEYTDLVYIHFQLDLVVAALQRQNTFENCSSDDIQALCERFQMLNDKYMTRIYHPIFIENESDWGILPSISCFGLYMRQAENARVQGDSVQYIHLLRKGLASAQNMKNLVEYLADQEMSKQKMQQASPELLQLADKVKAILSQYPEDDPAVQQLKSSEVYQKVAWLIEQPSTNYEM